VQLMEIPNRGTIKRWAGGQQTGHGPSAVRIGVLLSGARCAHWMNEALKQLLAAEGVDVAIVVVDERVKKQPLHGRHWLYIRLDRLMYGKQTGSRMEPCIYDRLTVQTTSLKNGELAEFDIARIQALHLDVLLDLRPGQPTGNVMKCAKRGVWYFESTVPGEDTSTPERIADWYKRQPTAETKVVELDANGGRSELYSSTLMADTLSLMRAQVTERKARIQIVTRLLSELHNASAPEPVVVRENDTESVEPASDPTSKSWMRRVAARLIADHFGKPQWVVAYRDIQSGDPEFRVIAGAPGYHYADPFLFEREGSHFLFFEAWRDGEKGVLCCMELGKDGPTSPRVILERPYHLSYPQVFEWKGEIYLLPETSQNRTVEAYRAVEFPWRWTPDAVLMDDVVAVDSTLLQHDGKLWLFAAGLGGKEFANHELSLFYSESLTGPWTAHPRNPIVRDVHRARSAGPIVVEHGRLIRPGQNSSRHYGFAISRNRIEVLSESEYAETPTISSIRPNWLPNLLATHTVGNDSRFEVRDAHMMMTQFDHLKFWQKRIPFKKAQLPLV
jgi:hypothetical protein